MFGLEDKPQGRTNFGFRYEDRGVDGLLAEGQRDGIGFKPAGGAFGNSRLFGDDDYMSGAQALVKDRGIFGPAAHDFGAWGDRFEIAADASAQGGFRCAKANLFSTASVSSGWHELVETR